MEHSDNTFLYTLSKRAPHRIQHWDQMWEKEMKKCVHICNRSECVRKKWWARKPGKWVCVCESVRECVCEWECVSVGGRAFVCECVCSLSVGYHPQRKSRGTADKRKWWIDSTSSCVARLNNQTNGPQEFFRPFNVSQVSTTATAAVPTATTYNTHNDHNICRRSSTHPPSEHEKRMEQRNKSW